MAHLVWLWLETQRYWVRIPARSDVCHQGCARASAVFKIAQRPGVYSAVVLIVHYK